MKKIIALTLLLTMIFSSLTSLSSCVDFDWQNGEKNENDSDNNNTEGENGNNGNGNAGNENTENGGKGFYGKELSREKLEYALSLALDKIDSSLNMFTSKFPSHSSTYNVYTPVENDSGWNTGFWTGILWHAYELTGEDKYKNIALSQIPSYYHRIENKIGVNHHDMGFVFTPSCVAAYKLTGDEQAKEAALMAADHLITRFNEKGQFIQAWGNIGSTSNYRLIVDCLMNISLLHWASEVTGDAKYRDIALKHYQTTLSVSYREDGSTYHTYYFDYKTGEPLKGVTHQGAGDDSTWSRGQAWGMYGPLLTYIYEKDEAAIETFKAATTYYLKYLPEDYVVYWDLSFTDGSGEPKDSSSAAIALCAMLEGIKHLDENDPMLEVLKEACVNIMNSLIDNYTTKNLDWANGLLLHGTYSKPSNLGVDEMTIWGDYFYMEALHRMLDPDWDLYW